MFAWLPGAWIGLLICVDLAVNVARVSLLSLVPAAAGNRFAEYRLFEQVLTIFLSVSLRFLAA